MGFRKVPVGASDIERVHFSTDVCKYLSIVDGSGVNNFLLGSHLLQAGDTKYALHVEIE